MIMLFFTRGTSQTFLTDELYLQDNAHGQFTAKGKRNKSFPEYGEYVGWALSNGYSRLLL